MKNIETTYRLPGGISKEIDAFEEKLERFRRGELSQGEFKIARVTSGIYEQRKQGTFMLRIRLPGGDITPSQIRHIVGIARRRNAYLHLTDRQEVQMHNLTLSDLIPMCRELLEASLSPRGGGGNTVRNITGCPRSGFCPNQVFDVTPFAIGTTEWMIAQKESYALPRKYKIAFSGCERDCAMATVADMGFIAKRKRDDEHGEQAGFTVYAASGMGAKSKLGIKLHDFVRDEEAVVIAEAVKRLFHGHGNRRNKHHNRLRFLLEDIGEEKFREIYAAEKESLDRHTNIPRLRAITYETRKSAGAAQEGEYGDRAVYLQKQEGLFYLELSVPLGNPSLDQLESLANLVEERKSLKIRFHQRQNILLYNIPGKDVHLLIKKLSGSGLEIARRKGIEFICCPGPSTCQLGICLSHGLQKQLEEDLSPIPEVRGIEKITIRISGCPNACSQHPVASLGFFGVARSIDGKLAPHYNIMVRGKVREGETRLAENIGRLSAKLIPPFTTEFLQLFADRGDGVSFDIYLESGGKEEARRLLEKYREMPHPDDVYFDFGQEEEFSLKGRGAGECSAGVFDMIGEDLKLSQKYLEESTGQVDPSRRDGLLYKGLLHAARALLVTQGLEARDEKEVFRHFRDSFIKKGYIGSEFAHLIECGIKGKGEEGVRDHGREIFRFREAVVALYGSMDKSLRFRIREGEEADTGAPPSALPAKPMDLRGILCPLNFVKVKLELEKLEKGERLEAILDAGRSMIEVPKSLKNEGHCIVKSEPFGESFKITVEKGG